MKYKVVYLPKSIDPELGFSYYSQGGFTTEEAAIDWAAKNRWCSQCFDEYKRMRDNEPSRYFDNWNEKEQRWYYDTPCDCEWVVIEDE